MTDLTAAVLLIRDEINSEIHKKRDNGTWGERSEAVSGFLFHFGDELDKKFKRLRDGESIYSILQYLEPFATYDEPLKINKDEV